MPIPDHSCFFFAVGAINKYDVVMTNSFSSKDTLHDAIRHAIDSKTKPVGALGRLEKLAFQIAAVQKTTKPQMASCRLTIFAGDHGMAAAGVSAYPQEVTRQMVLNFLSGGAAANVFAKSLDIDIQVVDAGVAGEPIENKTLLSRRIGAGTANAIAEPAMSLSQRDDAIAAGREIGAEETADAVCFGEMGIGNTSSASLLAHKILGLPLAPLIGRGTGVSDDGLSQKRELLQRAAKRTPDILEPQEALAEYGGFEIAMMAGAMLGAASAGKLIIVDGFIATAAAISALKMEESLAGNLVYGHRSEEIGHGMMLKAIDAEPLLDLGMRLGEGTGALLAWPLVKAAAAMLNDMATFDGANVSGPA